MFVIGAGSGRAGLRQHGRHGDVANAMLSLASDGADWITGQALVVDCGFSRA